VKVLASEICIVSDSHLTADFLQQAGRLQRPADSRSRYKRLKPVLHNVHYLVKALIGLFERVLAESLEYHCDRSRESAAIPWHFNGSKLPTGRL
jgi:hypothetical protein